MFFPPYLSLFTGQFRAQRGWSYKNGGVYLGVPSTNLRACAGVRGGLRTAAWKLAGQSVQHGLVWRGQGGAPEVRISVGTDRLSPHFVVPVQPCRCGPILKPLKILLFPHLNKTLFLAKNKCYIHFQTQIKSQSTLNSLLNTLVRLWGVFDPFLLVKKRGLSTV